MNDRFEKTRLLTEATHRLAKEMQNDNELHLKREVEVPKRLNNKVISKIDTLEATKISKAKKNDYMNFTRVAVLVVLVACSINIVKFFMTDLCMNKIIGRIK